MLAPTATPPAILPLSLEEVTFSAGGRPLIDRVSLQLSAGGRTVIMGPNGAGKSLLMRLCHGLLLPASGSVRWSATLRHAQAMVFQQPVLLRRSAISNVEFALKAAGTPRGQRRSLAEQALQQTGLAHLARRPARVMSGGEKQKLALARAWALRPQVLFLDEPTSHLDPGATRTIEELIVRFSNEGTKIVMSTHDLSQARRLADEVLFLHRGRVLEHTPAAAFFAQPSSQAAQAFINGELYWNGD